MEPENKYDELLVRYLLNESNAEEDQFVKDWISSSESNRLYLQNLFNTFKLVQIKEDLDKLDFDNEWQRFQQLKQAHLSSLSDSDQEVLNEEETLHAGDRQSNPRIYRLIIAGAVAASLIFAILITTHFFNSDKSLHPVITDKSKPGIPDSDSLVAVMFFDRNTTGKVKRITLPDKSEVELFPGSILTYREPANRSKREIILHGKADFKVTEDKRKPFTVFSGEISTTAFGTRFTVIAQPYANKIYILLHEGKVVVRSEKAGGIMKDVYLDHGQELIYNVVTETAGVRYVALGRNGTKRFIPDGKMELEKLTVPNYGKKAWFMFNNQQLNEIFTVLESMYNVKISYSKKDISNMYFIGTFHKTDSVEKILQEIASVNNLSITRENNEYKIKRNDSKEEH